MTVASRNDLLGEAQRTASSRRARPSSWWSIGAAIFFLGLIASILWPTPQISRRPNDMKTTQVILPPPPPPPEPIPQEKPPEPTAAPPIEQPLETPPPDQPSSEPAIGDSALTAREGAGSGNYGLAVGDGSGTRIGGRAGGANGFAAYASVALNGIRQAAQGDRDLSRGRYTVQLFVVVGPDGRILNVRVLNGGDELRNARLRQVLTGFQLSQRPPDGLPAMRIELNARSGT